MMSGGYMGAPMMTPPMSGMPPPMGMLTGLQRGMGGIYGEQFAATMGSAGRGAMSLGRLGVELGVGTLGSMAGSAAGTAMGYGAMGAGALGMAGGMAAAMPIMAAGGAMAYYGNAFTGGMQDQAALNSTLRNNFNFHGGSGPMGRGFGQAQMGQIGSMISSELRRNPFGNAQEMNSLVAGGAESGMLTGARDVQSFTTNFRRMLDTLRNVQRELGGTLTDALSFVRSSQQAGIFQNADRVNFAAEVRGAEAVTGMDRTQLTALAATGANISRSVGGAGRSGAMGMMRGVSMLGAAVSSGAVSAEALSEATGGLTGHEAIAAFSSRMMERAGAFSRTAAGRYSLFGLSNRDGTGMDADMMARFAAGDITSGGLSRRARENVTGMGRARALNREGALRGAAMEEGGLAFQLGVWRELIGPNAENMSDDRASLILQRRTGMSRAEAGVAQSMLRNSGSILERETMDRMGATSEADYNTDLRENRSVEAFMTRVEHAADERLGGTAAREAGARLVSRVSALVERVTGAIVGGAASHLSEGDRSAINRVAIGRGTTADIDLLRSSAGGGGAGLGGALTPDRLFRRSLAGDALGMLGIEGGESVGERLARRDPSRRAALMDARTSDATARDIESRARDAARGIVDSGLESHVARLEADEAGTTRRILAARTMAVGAGDAASFYSFMGENADVTDAAMSRMGMTASGLAPRRGALSGLAGAGWRDIAGAAMGGMATGAAAGALAYGGIGVMSGAVSGGIDAVLGLGGDPRGREGAAAFMARGGTANVRDQALAGESYLNMDTDYLQRLALGGRGTGESASRAEAALLVRGRGATGAGGATTEGVMAYTDTDDFRRRVGRMSSDTIDNGGRKTELEAMRAEIARMDPGSSEAASARNVVDSMEAEMATNGGRLGRDTLRLAADPERDAARREALGARASDMRGLARRLEGVGGGGAVGFGVGDARAMLERAAGAMASGDVEGANDSMSALRSNMAAMDPDSELYRNMASSLGTEESGIGRSFLASVASDRRSNRELSGRGRRGRRGRAEEALRLATGGLGTDDMHFTIGGRETTSETSIYEALAGNNRNESAADMEAQLLANLNAAGASDGTRIAREFREMAAGGLTTAEMGRMRELSEGDTGLARAARERSSAAAAAADPLGAERNNLLTQMRDSLRNIADGRHDGQHTETE